MVNTICASAAAAQYRARVQGAPPNAAGAAWHSHPHCWYRHKQRLPPSCLAAERATPFSSFVCGVSQLTQPCSNRLKATTVVQQHNLHSRLALCTGPPQQIPPLPNLTSQWHWPVSAPTTTHTRRNNAHSSIHTLCKTKQASRTGLPAKAQPQPPRHSTGSQCTSRHQQLPPTPHSPHQHGLCWQGHRPATRNHPNQSASAFTACPLPTAHNQQTHALRTYNRHSINTYITQQKPPPGNHPSSQVLAPLRSVNTCQQGHTSSMLTAQRMQHLDHTSQLTP